MNNSRFKSVFFVLPLLVVIAFIFIVYQSPVIITPSFLEKNAWQTFVSYDASIGGNSTGEIATKDNKEFEFKYELRDSIKYPFSLMTFERKDKKYINLHGYDKIEINIKASKGRRIPITLFTGISDYSSDKDYETYLRNRSLVFPNADYQKFNLSLDQLQVPSWWYSNNNLLEMDIVKQDWSQVRMIAVGNCSNVEHNVEDIIDVESIKFYKDMIPYYIGSLVFLSLSFLGIIIGFKLAENKAEIKRLLANQQTELSKDEKAVFDFIDNNYSNPELSLSIIQQELGINERKISSFVKTHEQVNFKQYLNQIRTNEAKRLLIENEKNISEIAFLVGYSNVTHFNRVFKSMESVSPSDYKSK